MRLCTSNLISLWHNPANVTEGLESWDDLRQFLAVARHGSLKAGAAKLGVNHSTVFRHIAALEEKLGVPVFYRHPRGYRLTPAGEEMMATAELVESSIHALDRCLSKRDEQLRGDVHVTAVAELVPILAPHLKRFHEQYPDISLHMNSDARFLSLTDRDADVALRAGRGPAETGVQRRILCSISLATYAAANYLRGRDWPQTAQDLHEHDMVGFHTPCTQIEMNHWIHENELNGSVIYRDNSLLGQLHAAQAGLGVAVLPTFVGDSAPELVRLFDIEPGRAVELSLLVHDDVLQTARVRTFVDFIVPALEAERDLIEGRRPVPRETLPPLAIAQEPTSAGITSKTLVAHATE